MPSSGSRKKIEGQNGVFGGKALAHDTADLYYEMDCFDRLGPKTKEAMHRVAFKLTAFRFTEWCERHGFDPRHPEIDAKLAYVVHRDVKKAVIEVPQTVGLDQPGYL